MSQTMNVTNYNKIDLSELNKADVDCIVGLLRRGTQDSSSFTDENNDELDNLSRKFLALLNDFGVDAIIASDLGTMSLIKKYAPSKASDICGAYLISKKRTKFTRLNSRLYYNG